MLRKHAFTEAFALRPLAHFAPLVPPLLALLQPGWEVKSTGLAQTFDQFSESNRDLRSNRWANLIILGQPCGCQVWGGAAAPPAREACAAGLPAA